MITIFEHTIEESIINKDGFILDLGCINFSFSKEVAKFCNNVICLDPNLDIKNIPGNFIYENKALINGEESEIDFYLYNDTHGCSILNPKKDFCILKDTIKVETTNLKKLLEKYNIKQFELIKFDIEGAEYEILNNIDWTISKQYSVEFHDFRSMNPSYPNNNLYYENLFKKMLKYCDIIKHEKTNHPGFPSGSGENYWDSLFILKKDYWI